MQYRPARATSVWFTVYGLALAAAGIRRAQLDEAIAVAIDARRQSWYGLVEPNGVSQLTGISRIPVTESAALGKNVFLPESFPIWNHRPEGWQDCPYQPSLLESAQLRSRLFRPVDQPDAFQLDPPTYQKWTPSINRTRSQSPHSGENHP